MKKRFLMPFPEELAVSIGKSLQTILRTDLITRQNEFYFQIPDGTKVSASHKGVVSKVEECSESLWTKSPEELHETNFVDIEHSDGTHMRYEHILPLVLAGQTVNEREVIGVSGRGSPYWFPHIHMVYIDKNRTNSLKRIVLNDPLLPVLIRVGQFLFTPL